MKKILSIFIMMNLMAIQCFTATVFTSGGKYGLKNDGKVVLKAEYQAIEQLSYTPSKRVIIPMHSMDEVEAKKLDLYKIKKNNLWGVANDNGRILNECKYKNVVVDENGNIQFTLPDGTTESANPVKSFTKNASNAVVGIVGLPVTIVGVMMMPIEAVSKIGRSK